MRRSAELGHGELRGLARRGYLQCMVSRKRNLGTREGAMFIDVGALAVWAFVTAVFSGIGAYVGSYLKQKGKNLATHEDIDNVLEQVSAVTKTTKEIEAKISSDVWDRQKRWELKREVLFEATRRLADVEDGLLSLNSVLQVEWAEKKEDEPGWAETKHERIMKWSKASAAFDETRLLVNMVCEVETIAAFEQFGALMNVTAAKISPGKDVGIYTKSLPEREKRRVAVRAAVRKELRVDVPASISS
jgi:hypothetical protein